MPLCNDLFDAILQAFATVDETIDIAFKVLELQILRHQGIIVGLLDRVTEDLGEFLQKTVLDQFEGVTSLLSHTFLWYESKALECFLHELACYDNARAVLVEPRISLDVVDEHVKGKLSVHAFIN